MKARGLFLVVLSVLIISAVACGGPATPQTQQSQAPAASEPTKAAEPTTAAEPTQATAPTAAAAPTEASQTTASSGAQSGGTLVWVNTPDPDTLDPHASVSSWVANQVYLLYDPLVWRGPEQQFYPGLAESWEVSSDGKTYTFHLRKDVKFHDGTPFNAEAVRYNFDRIKEGRAARVLGKAASTDLIGPYDSTEVIDDSTAAIHFTEPYPAFLDAVSTHFLFIVSPAAVDKFGDQDFGKHPVGSGPYIFKEWAPDHLTVVRNPDYNWAPPFARHQGPAYIETITHRFVDEAGTRSAMIKSGEAQIMSRPSTNDALAFAKDPGVTFLAGPWVGLPHGYFPNLTKYPMDDLKVRQALEYITSQELMVNTLWPDYNTPSHGPLATGIWAYNPEVEKMYQYDLEKGKALLDEAGWKVGPDGIRVDKDGKRFHMVVQTVPNPDMNAGYEFQQALYKDAGIEMEIVSNDSAATNDICTAGKVEACPLYFAFTDPGGLAIMFDSKNAGTGFNWGQIKDPKIDQMLADGLRETDETKRAQIYKDLQVYIMQQAYWVPMNEFRSAHVVSNKVADVQLSYKDAKYLYVYDAHFVQ
ncbi:MAG: ABC transporter substrate-binding protein [Ardenticatenaceae bacterium]|nr:ABC transporter substrate-binding protein [Ardenticatenaceae bacterium]HBY93218.1 hypothetical protein [Chloroflexota bacterium]